MLLYFKYSIKVKSYLQILSINIIPTVSFLIIRGHLENGSVAHPCMIIYNNNNIYYYFIMH